MIDIVIPHVDGSAPDYEDLCRRHTGNWVPCQVRELGTLRFVLRSIDANVPWVRQVVLAVQDDGHIPAWLVRERVRVVHHRDFIPPAHLPTFHWATIAAHLNRIPGLAERFVIWEDDVFAGCSQNRSDFYAADGLPRTDPLLAPILPGLERLLGGYQWNLARSRSLIARYCNLRVPHSAFRRACFLFPHMPSAVHGPTWQRMFDQLVQDPWFADTVTRQSRGDHEAQPTVDPLVVYANWIDIVERRRLSLSRYLECLRYWAREGGSRFIPRSWRPRPRFGSFPLVNDTVWFNRRLRELTRNRPTFFNINDNAYDGYRDEAGVRQGGEGPPNPRSLDSLFRTLERVYPKPSRFEAPEVTPNGERGV